MAKKIVFEGKEYSYFSEDKDIGAIDLLSFLDKQEIFPKFYWKEREGCEERIAFGSLLSSDKIPLFHVEEDLTFYGGCAFSPSLKSPSVWQGFPKAFFFLPRYEIIQINNKAVLRCYSLEKENSTDAIVWEPINHYYESSFCHANMTNTPTYEEWLEHVTESLHSIKASHIQKVVLARQTTLSTPCSINPFALLSHLKKSASRATYFLLQTAERSAFIGATPEKLYTRNARSLCTEALAGSIHRGRDSEEDHLLEKELKQSKKDTQEVEIVQHYLQDTLTPLCTKLYADPCYRVIQTSSMQHLYSKMSCDLKSFSSDAQILNQLHPTPAVGGMPKTEALSLLQQKEPFDRGWYAGPIGWLSTHAADFAVAIRSALVTKQALHLYAGAGIVEGSEPEKEWQELENKINQYKEILICKEMMAH